MLLRITFKSPKYAFENHIQQCKSAAENQFRLRMLDGPTPRGAQSLETESSHHLLHQRQLLLQ